MPARKRACPTPAKVRYESKTEALIASRRMPATRIECRVYRCRGHWHMTSHPR